MSEQREVRKSNAIYSNGCVQWSSHELVTSAISGLLKYIES